MSEQPLGNSEEITEPITESELFDWSSDLRLGAGRKFDRERLTRALAEVRRLREENKMKTVSMAELLKWTEEQDAKIDEQAQETEQLRGLVSAQATDEGLWFQAKTAPEAYLQQELRALHEAIEGTTAVECARAVLD